MITQRLYLKSPKEKESLILLELRKDGSKVRVSTGITIKSEYWNTDDKTINKKCPDYPFLSQKLTSFVAIAAKEILIAETKESTLEQLKNAILLADGRGEKQKEVAELLSFYKYWATTSFDEHTARRQHWQHYKVLCEFLKDEDIPFSAVDYSFYLRFKRFLDKKKGYKPNTTDTHLRDLKAVVNEAKNRGMHNSDGYLQIKRKSTPVDSVYLTIDEINKLYAYPLAGIKQMARDLFVLGCHTAMRYSDYSRLKLQHIHNGNIVNINKKTGVTVIVPAHPRVIEILRRWNGSPNVSQTMLNRLIKDICREMGCFDQLLPIRGGKTEYMQRFMLISTHTARRSGATNMYLSGIPAQSIMKITGHTTEASFLTYLKISKEENARLLAKNPFFTE